MSSEDLTSFFDRDRVAFSVTNSGPAIPAIVLGALTIVASVLLAFASVRFGTLTADNSTPVMSAVTLAALHYFRLDIQRFVVATGTIFGATWVFLAFNGAAAAIAAFTVMSVTFILIQALEHLDDLTLALKRKALAITGFLIVASAASSVGLGALTSALMLEGKLSCWIGMAASSILPALFIQTAYSARHWCSDAFDGFFTEPGKLRFTAELAALVVYAAIASNLIEFVVTNYPALILIGGLCDIAFIAYFYRRSFMSLGIALTLMFTAGNIGHAFAGYTQPLLYSAYIAAGFLLGWLIVYLRHSELAAGRRILSSDLESDRLRKATEMETAKNEAYEAAIANLTHDLKSPIAAVQGLLDWGQQRIAKQEDATRQFEMARSQINGLSKLVNNVLEMTHAELTNKDISFEKVDLNQIVNDVANSYRLFANSKDLALKVTTSQDAEMQVYHDRLRLHRMLSNLVENACKYTSEGSVELKLQVHDVDEDVVGVRIDVIDTGRGIPEAEHEKVFEKFHRVDGGFGNGLGLGLTIVSNMAETIGASLTLDSQPGQGSTFTLEFLAPKSDPAEVVAYHEQVERSVEDFATQILVVEDDPLHAKITSSVLAAYGNVKVAQNGSQALNEMSRRAFDLVVMDCRMPALDGFSTAEEIRASEAQQGNDGIPIIGLTSNPTANERRAHASGMDMVFHKPMTPEIAAEVLGTMRTAA